MQAYGVKKIKGMPGNSQYRRADRYTIITRANWRDLWSLRFVSPSFSRRND